MIFVPPDAPETISTFPVSVFTTIAGQVDDIGLLPGRIKFRGHGGTPKELVMFGELNQGKVICFSNWNSDNNSLRNFNLKICSFPKKCTCYRILMTIHLYTNVTNAEGYRILKK